MLREIVEELKKGILTTYLEYPADVKSLKKHLTDGDIKFKALTKNGMTRFEIDDEDKGDKLAKFVAKKYGVSLTRKIK